MGDYQVDLSFEGKNYSTTPPPKGHFENCRFIKCNFVNVNLSGILFIDCEFEDCDFTNAKLVQTGFQNAEFHNCKLMGLGFDTCSDFLLSFTFTDCNLHFSSFYRLKIPGTRFKNCSLRETDLTESDLSRASFSNCDFTAAIFDQTILEKCDFRDSVNYSLDPSKNRIKNARFSLPEVLGLLEVFQIKIE